ncbi:MAG: winged helix-turn-helix domain-containing protein [Gammaproteobacteria bacterium]
MLCASSSPAGGAFSRHPFLVGSWRIDPIARRASSTENPVPLRGNDARECRLTPKAMAVLVALAEAQGEVVTRQALIDAVWPEAVVGDETLTHAVAELRRALDDRRPDRKLLETVHKTGYRLCSRPTLVESAARADREDAFDLDAYLLCLEARRLIERSDIGGASRSVSLCVEAVARAPRFALAQAEFAVAVVTQRLYYGDCGPPLEAAAAAAATATQLRPDQGFTHAALGYALCALERHDQARRAFESALSRDPRDFSAHYLFARSLFAAGEMAAAARLAEQAATLQPDDYRSPYLASAAFAELGDDTRAYAAAIAGLERVQRRLEADPQEPRARNIMGPLLARVGRADDAIQAVAKDEQSGNSVQFYNVAALARAGEITEAISRLERIVDQGWRHHGWLRFGPTLPALRREPRFRQIESALAGL